jgi:hypothetical protein
MYAYIEMIVLSYSWQVERWMLKAGEKNLEKCNMPFSASFCRRLFGNSSKRTSTTKGIDNLSNDFVFS